MTNLNRLPTKTESFVGAAVALLLSSGLGFVLVYVFRAAYERPEILTPFVISVLAVLPAIFAWSSALFLRILFGSPELPSFKGQVMIGWFMVVFGIVLCGSSVLIASVAVQYFISQKVLLQFLLDYCGFTKHATVPAHRPNKSFKSKLNRFALELDLTPGVCRRNEHPYQPWKQRTPRMCPACLQGPGGGAAVAGGLRRDRSSRGSWSRQPKRRLFLARRGQRLSTQR